MTTPAVKIVGPLLGIALACSACGGGAPAAPAPAAPPPTATSNAINPVPRDKVQNGGTLTWPLDSMPVNFNYHEIDGTPLDGSYVLNALMPVTYDTDAGAVPVWSRNYLASEPVLTTEPRQVVTYEINPKAKWDDGSPITWEDFNWQWKASSGTDKAYRIASSNGYEDIQQVERGKDDREVIVTFKTKYADWQAVFNPIYPSSTNKDPGVFNDGWKAKPLVTAGPFKFGSLDATAKTITILRNEKWWGDPAKLDKIVFRVIDPDAQIDALANGEIDAMDIGPDANKYNRAKGIAGAEVRAAGGPNFRHLTINGTSPRLSDVKVRTALAMAIDRAAVARTQLGPLGVEVRVLNNHIFMGNQVGYQDNSGEVGTYNPDKAKQLLDEAGWKLEGNVRKKGGQPLEITCVIPAGVATSRQESELIQNLLGQVGVTLKISVVPINDFFDKYVRPGQFDFTVFSWIEIGRAHV